MSFPGHRPRRRFAQHWLLDPGVLDRIVAAAELRAGERVLEVGPGRGALTERLLATPLESLEAVELDRDLVVGLRERFGGDPRFLLRQGDVLRLPLESTGSAPVDKVVANIPYNITGPLLELLVGRLDRPRPHPFRRLVLLVQREVGQRLHARAGESAFSALSVRMQLMARCRSVCTVPPRCFRPPPKVDSEVVVLDPLSPSERLSPTTARTIEQLLRCCFAARRKMLRNSLASLVCPDRLAAVAAEAAIDLQQRPQDLAPERWIALAEGLNRALAVPPVPTADPPPHA